MPGDMLVEAAAIHPVIDELVMQRRINEGPKLPRDVASLQRAVENLADENDHLRRGLQVIADEAADVKAAHSRVFEYARQCSVDYAALTMAGLWEAVSGQALGEPAAVAE